MLVDAAVLQRATVVIGSGLRRSKLPLPAAALAELPAAEVIDGTGRLNGSSVSRWLTRRGGRRSRRAAASCSSPLLATALPCCTPSTPFSPVKRPPASVTMGASAAMS